MNIGGFVTIPGDLSSMPGLRVHYRNVYLPVGLRSDSSA